MTWVYNIYKQEETQVWLNGAREAPETEAKITDIIIRVLSLNNCDVLIFLIIIVIIIDKVGLYKQYNTAE